MKRALIASTVVLTLALAFLVFRRFTAPPPAPPSPPAEAAHAEPAKAPEPAKVAEPAKAPEPAKAAELAKAPEPAKEAPAKPAEPPLPVLPKGPEPRPERQRRAERSQPDAASSAAIFADRPPGDEEPGRRVLRLPVLRKPSPGMASPSDATAAAAATRARPSGGTWRAASPSRSHAPPRAPPPAGAVARAPSPARSAAPGQRLPGAVFGTLSAAGGERIASTSVLAMSATGDDAFETVTDDDGVYLLAGMKPGRYLVFTGLGSGSAAALPARSVEVEDGRVTRADLREPRGGATVRVRPLRPDGQPAAGEVVLVAGQVASPATLSSLLAGDAIYLPAPGSPDVLRHVPAGAYTVVLLQGAATAPRVAPQVVVVRGEGEQLLEVRLPAEAAAAQRRR